MTLKGIPNVQVSSKWN